MSTLYRPVKITSAEQAEALPEGAIIRDPQLGWEYGRHEIVDGDLALDILTGVRPVALVPIEAEEEWTVMGEDHGDPWIAHLGFDGLDGTHEEAEAYTRRFGGFLARRDATAWQEADQ